MSLRIYLPPLLSIILAFCFSCQKNSKSDENTLAVIGERTITASDFVERYRDFRARTGDGVPDMYEARRQVLATYVDEEILILQAERLGLGQDDAAVHERERIEMQQLLNAFNKHEIAAKVRVEEAELRELFVRLNTKIKARHLYAATRQQADSIYTLLQNGADFEELADELFADEHLRKTGGLIGYFTVDDMEPSFEEAAFALPVGKISAPVKTSDGYSIIRVDDRVRKPLLTESEFARHKGKLESYWHGRKVKKAIEAFSDSVARGLAISFEKTVLRQLYERFRQRQELFDAELPAEIADSGADFERQTLLTSEIGNWTVGKFREKARFTSAKQHEWIRSLDDFRQFVAGLLIREVVLSEARRANLHKKPDYREQVQEKWDRYLLTRMETRLQEEMQVPADSVRRYYEEDPDRFAAPPEINLAEIVVRTEAKAGFIADQLRGGVSFEKLTRAHSEREWSAANGGELGFLAAQDLGIWSQKAFALAEGEWTGPLQIDSMQVFLKCLAKKPASRRGFEEIQDEVEKTVRYLAWDDFRKARLSDLRASFAVEVYAEKLRQVKLN